MPAIVHCPECAGVGVIEAYDPDMSRAARWIECERCHGDGEVEADPNVMRFPVDSDECVEVETDDWGDLGEVVIRRLVCGESRQAITLEARTFAELAAWAVGRWGRNQMRAARAEAHERLDDDMGWR